MKKIAFLLLVAALVLYLSFAGRTTIGPDMAGVRLGPLDHVAVFQPGQRPFTLPLVHRLVRLTTKPILFVMAGVGAVPVTIDGKALQLDCRLRYQVTDPAAVVHHYGTDDPQTGVEQAIRRLAAQHFDAGLDRAPNALDAPGQRILLIAETHAGLNQALTPTGITVLSLEILSW